MTGNLADWRRWIDNLPQRTRRVIAGASLLGLPSMYAWSALWLKTDVPSVVWGPVSFLLIFLTLGGAFVLYAFVRDRANREAHLDERQRMMRDRAWILCYEVLSGVLVVAVIGLGVFGLVMGQVVTLDGAAVSAIVICTGVLVPLLPVAALAWVEPDPLREA